jgi:hypothetical protein
VPDSQKTRHRRVSNRADGLSRFRPSHRQPVDDPISVQIGVGEGWDTIIRNVAEGVPSYLWSGEGKPSKLHLRISEDDRNRAVCASEVDAATFNYSFRV